MSKKLSTTVILRTGPPDQRPESSEGTQPEDKINVPNGPSGRSLGYTRLVLLLPVPSTGGPSTLRLRSHVPGRLNKESETPRDQGS